MEFRGGFLNFALDQQASKVPTLEALLSKRPLIFGFGPGNKNPYY